MREIWSKLRAVGERRAIAGELAEELESHVEMETRAGLERGMTPTEARAAALRRVGNRASIAERAGDAWGFPAVDAFFKDVRMGFRGMRRSRGFSAVVILTLALGIGITTSIFSVVRQVLLKPLPYPGGERILRLGESTGRAEGISVTWVNFKHWRDSNRSFENMAAYQFTERTITGRGDPVLSRGLLVTAPYFPMLGMRPLLGRLFDARDDQRSSAPAVVLNHRFWSSRLGGDPSIVGATLLLNGSPYEVAGVAAPLWEPWKVDYYLPLGKAAGETTNRAQHGSIRSLARLRPGVTLAAARADLDSILRDLAALDPGPETEHRAYAAWWAETNTSDVRSTLLILMGASVLILLIACANVASLLVARNLARGGELALRKAIGAGRLRLARQLLTETSVIAAIGGAVGIALAYGVLRALVALAPSDIPRLADTSLDVPVLLFACGLTLASGLAAGLAPVLMAGRVDLSGALKEGWRLSGGGRRKQSLRNTLVVAEVALTFVLAFGSGLLLRSLIAAERVDPGFRPERLLSFELQLPSRAYRTRDAVADFYSRLLAGLRATPGAVAASMVYAPPGGSDRGDWFYSIAARPAPPKNDLPIALFNSAEAGYFQTMGIAIRQGREFTVADTATAPKVAIVNETFARQWWPGGGAVGNQIKFGGPYQEGPLLEIVGVAADVRQDGLDTKPMPEIYQPYAQRGGERMAIMVRSAGNASALMPAVRAQVRALDPNLPLLNLETMEKSLGASLARRRFSTLLLGVFAGLALTLATIGIFGLLSYWVSVRESEIAVRLALGARPSVILRWTGMHALRLAACGVAVGMMGAWVAARGLADLVFGIPPRHPASMISAALAVFAIAVVASAVPAWRAARVDAARRLQST